MNPFRAYTVFGFQVSSTSVAYMETSQLRCYECRFLSSYLVISNLIAHIF